jgi:transposase InsO family protein
MAHGVSERRGCVALGVGRSTIRCRSTKPDQAPLRLRICDIAKTRVRYGYFRMYILLRREGWMVNHKRVYRLYREGLGLRLKRPRRSVSAADPERQPAATRANELWSMDFVSDALFDGRRLRMSRNEREPKGCPSQGMQFAYVVCLDIPVQSQTNNRAKVVTPFGTTISKVSRSPQLPLSSTGRCS